MGTTILPCAPTRTPFYSFLSMIAAFTGLSLMHVVPAACLRAPACIHSSRRASSITAQLDESAFAAMFEYGTNQAWRDRNDASMHDRNDDAFVTSASDDSQPSAHDENALLSAKAIAASGGNAPPAIMLAPELDARFTTPSMQMQAVFEPVAEPSRTDPKPLAAGIATIVRTPDKLGKLLLFVALLGHAIGHRLKSLQE